MSQSRSQSIGRRARLLPLYASWAVRGLWPTRKVTRHVQGVDLVLPWSHRLPDYAKFSPDYGQNLVQLAAAIAREDGAPLTMLDIGANVGDSAVQVLHAADGSVLCVEGDAYYLEFLHANVDKDARVVVEESLVVTDGSDSLVAVRSGGTSRFEESTSGAKVATLSPEALRAKYPAFDGLRLIKSDTDGYDVTLVPAVTRAWQPATPVLFFEYDERLSAKAGNDAAQVWPELAGLGYAHVGIWDNAGERIGLVPIADVPGRLGELAAGIESGAFHYWDVAVTHADDATGTAALRSLFA
ncbi:hypothetical protein ACFQ0K_13885 [Nocardioides caeni]|uniref:FkbM family methyltransferase n=1 Tax=Nocardioides caeni TaxID=574700 RepID=A0A4S8N0M9_9ACTN|nr:hypothetical protein [Nocardioides caeni]THV09215.1 hypothetical protein E9934_16725 [Nocardioides caeni]